MPASIRPIHSITYEYRLGENDDYFYLNGYRKSVTLQLCNMLRL